VRPSLPHTTASSAPSAQPQVPSHAPPEGSRENGAPQRSLGAHGRPRAPPHSWPSAAAHTRQQPQRSGTGAKPAEQVGRVGQRVGSQASGQGSETLDLLASAHGTGTAGSSNHSRRNCVRTAHNRWKLILLPDLVDSTVFPGLDAASASLRTL
ncbi:mCG146298, partial [Mus musculus]